MAGKLQDRIAVITGGNSGIGLATAREFKANGARVVIFGRNRQTLGEAAANLGDGSLAVQGHVRNLGDIDSLFEQTGRHSAKSTCWSPTPASRNSRRWTFWGDRRNSFQVLRYL